MIKIVLKNKGAISFKVDGEMFVLVNGANRVTANAWNKIKGHKAIVKALKNKIIQVSIIKDDPPIVKKDVSELTAKELEKIIDSMDIEEIVQLIGIEKNNKNRKSVLSILEGKLK